MTLCSIQGCGRPLLARGWCKRHYDRWRRHGDPETCLKGLSDRGEPMRWIADHAGHDGDECLTWPFARFPDGRAHMNGAKPARVMCEMVHGPAPTPQHEAAHSCGKGHEACINPRHLRWATPKENAADKEVHGTVIRGSAHYGSKLSDHDVRRIRSLKGKIAGQDLAQEYGVNPSSISKIQNGKRWGHVQ